jgi:hypothetical protein
MRPSKNSNIEDLLAEVRRSSERVRFCAEEVMDKIIVTTHQTVNNSHKVSSDIHMITRQTEKEVGQLRGKIDEILNHQKSFQLALDAVSSKNSLLSFLMEYLSKWKSDIVPGNQELGYNHLLEKNQGSLRKPGHPRSLHSSTSQAHL